MTLGQFRAWLSGVEDMQDHDWTPSSTQWKKIREKIDAIEDDKPTYPGSIPTNVYIPRGVVPLMEPAPYPPNVGLLDQSMLQPNESYPTLNPIRFESDIINPQVTPQNNPIPKVDGQYRSGYV